MCAKVFLALLGKLDLYGSALELNHRQRPVRVRIRQRSLKRSLCLVAGGNSLRQIDVFRARRLVGQYDYTVRVNFDIALGDRDVSTFFADVIRKQAGRFELRNELRVSR